MHVGGEAGAGSVAVRRALDGEHNMWGWIEGNGSGDKVEPKLPRPAFVVQPIPQNNGWATFGRPLVTF